MTRPDYQERRLANNINTYHPNIFQDSKAGGWLLGGFVLSLVIPDLLEWYFAKEYNTAGQWIMFVVAYACYILGFKRGFSQNRIKETNE